jgi:hypothetical protein
LFVSEFRDVVCFRLQRSLSGKACGDVYRSVSSFELMKSWHVIFFSNIKDELEVRSFFAGEENSINLSTNAT